MENGSGKCSRQCKILKNLADTLDAMRAKVPPRYRRSLETNILLTVGTTTQLVGPFFFRSILLCLRAMPYNPHYR